MKAKTTKTKPMKKETKGKAKNGHKEVAFRAKADPGSTVFVAGTFNNWDIAKDPLFDNDGAGNFIATLWLAPGEYQYKFVINGEWRPDSDCASWVANEFGTLNSILQVL